MDNFMDKLVEKINSQGQARAQSLLGLEIKNNKASKEQLQALADFEEKLAKSFTQDVTSAVNESNARYVEMLTQYMRDNAEGRLSATEEMMAAQASAREGIIENTHTVVTASKNEFINALKQLQDDNRECFKRYTEELTDTIHKECVKVYKNTQAAMEEENNKKSEDQPADTGKGNNVIKGLLSAAIVLLGLNLAGMVVVLLWIFKVI